MTALSRFAEKHEKGSGAPGPSGSRAAPWSALLLLFLAACAAEPPPPSPYIGAPQPCLERLRVLDVDFEPVPDGGSKSCPIVGAVKVTRVGQAKLDKPAVMTCTLAEQLSEWEGVFVQPTAKRLLGGPVTTMHHYGTYACRRSTGKSSRMSEHARANAIDIGIFETAAGTKASVTLDWNGRDAKAEFLKQVGQGACTLFAGVLGPDSDANHRDHFHFDMGPWPFCQLNMIDPRTIRK